MRGVGLRAAVSLSMLLTACATAPERPANRTLSIERDFAGTRYAYGVFEQGGRVTERFTARMEGRAVPGGFSLYERFRYEDGFTWARTWRFTPRGGGLYDGAAETVVGPGRIAVLGDTVRMRFTADQPQRAGAIRLQFDQRLTLLADGVIVNRSTVRKFGLPVGRITMTIVKPGAEPAEAAAIPEE